MDRATERAIEWDCTQLIHDFYLCLDEKRYADLLDLFAADGAWVRLGTELKGRTQIAEAMSERDHWVTAHVVSNVRVRVVDETSAHSTQYITLYRHEGSTAASGPVAVVPPLGLLRHQDTLVRVGEHWRFQRKTSRAIMVDRDRVTHYDRAQGR